MEMRGYSDFGLRWGIVLKGSRQDLLANVEDTEKGGIRRCHGILKRSTCSYERRLSGG